MKPEGNIFKISEFTDINKDETFETLFSTDNLKIERIISHKSLVASDNWFDQEWNEWVVLLTGKATLEFKDGEKLELNTGDYILLPSHKVHRVIYTTEDPKCIWLGVHFNN